MNPPSSAAGKQRPAVAVIGGGLAGLAAAVAASEQGLHVELFEARRQLGGRAGSFRDPQTGQIVDFCPHVALGCCTNLLDFCRRTGIADQWQSWTKLNFFAPDGRLYAFAPCRWLPAPLHLGPALLRLKYLTRGERCGIARALGRLGRVPVHRGSDEQETVGHWLRRQGQSERMIALFWSIVLQSALGETVEHASLNAARKVLVDGFLASRRACEVLVPRAPLGEILDRRVGAWLSAHNVPLHRSTRVRQIDFDARRAAAALLCDGARREFNFVIVAVPWRQLQPLLPPPMPAAMPALAAAGEIPPAPITAVHVWFDRPLSPLPHAVLVGRTSQWVFNRGRQDAPTGAPQYFYQVVISASHDLTHRRAEDVLAAVRGDLQAIWPAVGDARLLHWRVITHRAAVFSPRPGIDRLRPPQQTPVGNLLLAGDWTATGWPATMESAVRSGYLAVEAVLRTLGRNEKLLVADLPRGPLARLLLGHSDTVILNAAKDLRICRGDRDPSLRSG